MNSSATEKRLQLRQECRETAAEVLRLLAENLDDDNTESELETSFRLLESAKRALEKKDHLVAGVVPSPNVHDDSNNTEANVKHADTINEAIGEGSEGGSSTPSVPEFDVPIGIHDVQGFMEKTMDIAKRSFDNNTKVGAVIVDPQTGHDISTGYNHMAGHSEEFQWASLSEDVSWLDSKYPYVVHAAVDAINKCELRSDLKGAIMITNIHPGHESAKQIVEAGIKYVWYRENKYPGQDFIIASERILRANGVECKKVPDT